MSKVSDVIQKVCDIQGVSVEEVKGHRQNAKLDLTRAILYHILQLYYDVSSYQLAEMFNRTRRNIMRRKSSLRQQIKFNTEERRIYNGILQELGDE